MFMKGFGGGSGYIIKCLYVLSGYISEDYSLSGHRDVRCTQCPGSVLYKKLETWDNWHRLPVRAPNCTQQ